MMQKPKLIDPAAFQSYPMEQLAALVTALGGDRRQLYLSFLATVTQADFDEYMVCRPELPAVGSGRAPGPRLVVKPAAELFAIARRAAKQGKRPDEIYPDFSRDAARRLTSAERTEIAKIGRKRRARDIPPPRLPKSELASGEVGR